MFVKNNIFLMRIMMSVLFYKYIQVYELFALNEKCVISKNKLLHTFSVFPKEYEITFEACFTSFTSGDPDSTWSNVFNFNLGNSNSYSYRVIGIWFNSKGDMVFYALINNIVYSKKFASVLTLGCHQYSISQGLFHYYNVTINISGKNIFTIKNTSAKEFSNVKMYFSDPWYDSQPGYIKNLLVTKGCSEKSNILQNNPLQTIAVFPIQYEITFEACLTTFTSGNYSSTLSNLFNFTNSGYGYCVVCMGFFKTGEMQLSALINSTSYSFTTKSFELGCKQYKISQTLYQESYIFTILVDGWTLSTVKNLAPQEFNNVQIYISDPWTVAQPGYISNFNIMRRCSDLFSLKEEYYINSNRLFHTIEIFPKEYEITFEICLTSYTSGNNLSTLSNVFFFTNAGNISCVLCMWFTPNGEMQFSAMINRTLYKIATKPFNLGCKNYKINQVLHHGYYIFSIEVDNLILTRVKNFSPQEFTKVQLYISDPWYKAQPSIIRNLIIKKGCSDCNLYYEPLLNVTYDGNILGNVLIINFVINYNDPVESAVSVTWEYFLPPFLYFQSEGTSEGVVKISSNNLKYKIDNINNVGVKQSITLTIKNDRCLFGRSYSIDIPMTLYFENDEGRSWKSFKKFTKYYSENCSSKNVPTIPKHVSEYYGRGIYWNDDSFELYLCINQYVTTLQNPACFITQDSGASWDAMDQSIGAVLGHDISTGELYAIHRNQKLYLKFNTVYKKWLAVTNDEFKKNISNNLNWKRLKTIEENFDQTITFGTSQWMVNGVGIYFRKLGDNIWIQRIKWND
ncbi:uncharacterized protein LOC136091580 isoform X2 [Hydra vulgaris]|uniref:Uncharacterized protein LOC136091580 isoform X2 n=1 Tax=Hydra vulgaris TaxID=6087 RepID=A0ABM4DLC7_HYDVU